MLTEVTRGTRCPTKKGLVQTNILGTGAHNWRAKNILLVKQRWRQMSDLFCMPCAKHVALNPSGLLETS